MRHVSGRQVEAQVSRWVWQRAPLIDDDVAVTIASYYQSPSLNDEQITHLAQKGTIHDVDLLIDEIIENGKWLGHPTDLAALLAWAESKR